MSGHRVLKASILALPIFCASVACALAQQAPASEAAKNLTPVTNEMLRNPPAADWLMWRRTYDGWGYSPLDQINKDNVKNLKPAWTWSLTTGRHRDDADRPRRRAVHLNTTPTRSRRSTPPPAT